MPTDQTTINEGVKGTVRCLDVEVAYKTGGERRIMVFGPALYMGGAAEADTSPFAPAAFSVTGSAPDTAAGLAFVTVHWS